MARLPHVPYKLNREVAVERNSKSRRKKKKIVCEKFRFLRITEISY